VDAELRVLLTNDDGIDAPGLGALERSLASRPGIEVWTAAPAREMSTCSHSMTIARPIFARQIGERRFAVEGTTADSVYFAIFGPLAERPHVVISGVNQGPNLGTDVFYSGTVAGAREAVMRGVHGVSVSLVEGTEFAAPARSAADVALELARLDLEHPLLLNLNYPVGDFSGPRLAPLGQRTYPEEVVRREIPGRGGSYYWLGGPLVADRLVPYTDGWQVERGVATATLLAMDQTDVAAMATAAERLPFLQPAEEAP
jgi:5'-nucleotidase